MNLSVEFPRMLSIGLLALLPLWLHGHRRFHYPWLALIPSDPISTAIGIGIRVMAALSIVALALGMAGLHLEGKTIERIGQGAQIALVLDKSSSMDQTFAGRSISGSGQESKGMAARRLLAEFVSRRPADLFSMVAFSTAPILVLPFNRSAEGIQAAIRAAESPGLAFTNVGRALGLAIDGFKDLPQTGGRILLLVSDGAARIDDRTQQQLRTRLQQHRVNLLWIFLRTEGGPGVFDEPKDSLEADTVPEYALHRYFQTLEVPYHAYQAESAEELDRAIRDVALLANQPIRYQERIPRRDLSGLCYAVASALILGLVAVTFLEVRRWPG